MSIALAAPRHVFGLKSDVSNNVWYLDEQTIVYPSGSNCILYNIDQRTQKFIPCSENSHGMTALAVSPNKRYVAIAEKGEKPSITIYDLHSLRKRKVLTTNEGQSSLEFVSIAFSPDSKYLVAQGGRPDWVLHYWTWEKAKVLAITKSTNQQNSPLYQVYQRKYNFRILSDNNTTFLFMSKQKTVDSIKLFKFLLIIFTLFIYIISILCIYYSFFVRKFKINTGIKFSFW